MSLFGAIVRTAVNVALVPVDVAKDVVTLGGTLTDTESSVHRRVRRIKTEADTDYDETIDRLFKPEDHR